MDISANLRLNMTGAEADPTARALRYQAAIDMAAYADHHGFSSVNVEEHHVAENGWLPSPLTMAAAIAARTEHCSIGVMALLVSLYDPIRLAEDIAVIDLLSNGRMNFVAGLGYREVEFHIANKPFAERGKWMDHVLETLLKAWGDEPFEYKGRMVNVTPKPFTRPHPFFLVGGMSKPAARRAARLGLPFAPPVADPELEAYYHEQCKLHGNSGFTHSPPEDFSVLFIHENPDKAWEELGQYFLNEVMEYSSWKTEGVNRPLEFSSDSVAALRAEKRYEIITPLECMRRHRERDNFFAAIHPLIGGMPLDDAWHSLRLYAEQVVAPLLAEQQR
ncbi:MAG: alkanesulfonate monooxygenase SsuD [Bacteroidia bacterium]|jgi:alkanesulfonate monooxygenase SsuD/methylene tetrahydromethanopterin reductase-like flavin-dependent oxidoreductase (luciferase family)